ncbi:MAG: two-component sensor histidine kinase [Planctomycetes bacterium]|nr:two-component sensor histidine kinase [Planctomycetota bacterium]
MLGMGSSENKSRQSRLAFLGTLASGLAHEIKNPLSAMSVNLQMLREDLEANATSRETRMLKRVGVLEREVVRLEEILDGFLRFARGYKLDPTRQSLNALLREVVEFWAAKAAAAGVDVQLVLEPDLPDVEIDANYVKQALLNLLNNAFDALTQRPAAEKSGREQILVCSRRGKSGVELLVIDNGPGISADARTHIFDPYFSTKAGGSGLGLPTARRIIEELGGTLTFDTELDRGTSFRIELKTAADPQPPSDAPPSPPPAGEPPR